MGTVTERDSMVPTQVEAAGQRGRGRGRGGWMEGAGWGGGRRVEGVGWGGQQPGRAGRRTAAGY